MKSRYIKKIIKNLCILLAFCSMSALSACSSNNIEGGNNMKSGISWLDNGKIKLGINLDLGGSITYLALINGENMINSRDWGRQVQMSFYSGPVPYQPEGATIKENWKQLGWNPIQSGDTFGNRSTILEHKNNGKEIYVKSIPMHWPLDNVPGECTFEVWYSLDGYAVKVRSRLNNNRTDNTTQYTARNQELPAVYTNGPWYKLVSYTGCAPFTDDAPTVLVDKEDGKGWPWLHYMATENWAALLNDENSGLGVINPGSFYFLGGFSGKKGSGGPNDPPTGYISPLQKEVLDYNITYDYEYYLYTGTLEQIRKFAKDIIRKVDPPTYIFRNDRQHWSYSKISDDGWPVNGNLSFAIDAAGGSLDGPKCFWYAKDAAKLYIYGAFETEAKNLTVKYDIYDGSETSAKTPTVGRVQFNITGDGSYRLYEVDLSQSPLYKGSISRICLLFPSMAGKAYIKAIGFDQQKMNRLK